MKRAVFVVLLLTGCASLDRGCASCSAESFGADWIVVQQRATDGKVFNCWLLRGVSVVNETQSDGIYWKDAGSGHLVHIAGQYARVQVTDGRFKDAATLIGVDAEQCRGGAYPSTSAE